ncbi:hypothetical protein QCA50_004749 [Cerrena zonata]|uniref:Uncharacterized protein n=1 Tax=Cerrena zonata TaxID=2478898 RepID=A0AAW0GMD5_9APHY
MFSGTFTKLAIAAIAVYTALAKPILPVPGSGKYRIQSAATGLYMDAFESEQGAGTPVIWTLDVFESPFASIQSTSSFVLDALSGAGGLVLTLNPTTASEFELIPVVGGVQICIDPTGFGCLASPTTPITRVSILTIDKGALVIIPRKITDPPGAPF